MKWKSKEETVAYRRDEGSATTVYRLITTSRGSINPSFVTKKDELAEAKDTFHNGSIDSINLKIHTRHDRVDNGAEEKTLGF